MGPSQYFLRLMVLSRVEVNRGMSVMLDLLLWSRLWTGGYPGPLVKPSPPVLLYPTILYTLVRPPLPSHTTGHSLPPPSINCYHNCYTNCSYTFYTQGTEKHEKQHKGDNNCSYTLYTQGIVFLSLYLLSLCLFVLRSLSLFIFVHLILFKIVWILLKSFDM